MAAAELASILDDGWQEAVGQRITDYVTTVTWRQLLHGRRRRRCTTLAKIAAAILAGKKQLHDLVASVAGWFTSLVGADRVARAFVSELARSIPLPPDAKLVATARGTQVAGILLCLARGDNLIECQCFIDLALTETKTQMQRILVAATANWSGLADFPPRDFPTTAA
jgi:hypothetical protein